MVAWRSVLLQCGDSQAMLATVWRFSCLALVRTTQGVLRNVGLSCSPLLPPLSLCLCLTLCPLPSTKQGISLTFLFFSQGYSSIFHCGAHILSQIAALRTSTPRHSNCCKVLCALVISGLAGQSSYQWLWLWLLCQKPVVSRGIILLCTFVR